MIKIKFIEYGRWRWMGYQAIIQLIDLEQDKILETLLGSTWPNPFDSRNRDKRLEKAAAAISAGIYEYQYSKSAHNGGPGFNINDNGRIPTICNNPNQGGAMYADHVDIHIGYKDGPDAFFENRNETGWRGSYACLTVKPVCWPTMQLYFSEGARGPLEVVRPFEVG